MAQGVGPAGSSPSRVGPETMRTRLPPGAKRRRAMRTRALRREAEAARACTPRHDTPKWHAQLAAPWHSARAAAMHTPRHALCAPRCVSGLRGLLGSDRTGSRAGWETAAGRPPPPTGGPVTARSTVRVDLPDSEGWTRTLFPESNGPAPARPAAAGRSDSECAAGGRSSSELTRKSKSAGGRDPPPWGPIVLATDRIEDRSRWRHGSWAAGAGAESESRQTPLGTRWVRVGLSARNFKIVLLLGGPGPPCCTPPQCDTQPSEGRMMSSTAERSCQSH